LWGRELLKVNFVNKDVLESQLCESRRFIKSTANLAFSKSQLCASIDVSESQLSETRYL
jgi:hypothetical protein